MVFSSKFFSQHLKAFCLMEGKKLSNSEIEMRRKMNLDLFKSEFISKFRSGIK